MIYSFHSIICSTYLQCCWLTLIHYATSTIMTIVLTSSTNYNCNWQSFGFYFRSGWRTQGTGFNIDSNLTWNSFLYWTVLWILFFLFPLSIRFDLKYCIGVSFLKHSVFLFSLSHSLLLTIPEPFPTTQYPNLFVWVSVFLSRHPQSIHFLLILSLSTLISSCGHPRVPLCVKAPSSHIPSS